MKNYYFADAEYIDRIYGNESPVCVWMSLKLNVLHLSGTCLQMT